MRVFGKIRIGHLSLKINKEDVFAGISVALILIPQSLAYAQLAGLPAHYGLYSAFIPMAVASIAGSSRFLATGPVAMVSLLTASALGSMPITHPDEMTGYIVLLSLLVGSIQLLLGIMRLGMVINLISHPVIVGFSSAAAFIIATSQLPKIFGVTVDNYEHYYQTMYHFVITASRQTHFISLVIASVALVIMVAMRRYAPKLPSILIVIILCATLSRAFGYGQTVDVSPSDIISPEFHRLVNKYSVLISEYDKLNIQKKKLLESQKVLMRKVDNETELIALGADIDLLGHRKAYLETDIKLLRGKIRSINLTKIVSPSDRSLEHRYEATPKHGFFEKSWKISIGDGPIGRNSITLTTGGNLVGVVPSGLPVPSIPRIDFSQIPSLINAAAVIAMLGFMESISIARSLAVKAGDRINPNRELFGQGIANLTGALTQGYPVAGSFSRTAVNYHAGAKSKYSSIFTFIFVLITLIYLTPLLYYIPQPVLAAIIVYSVTGLVSLRKIREIWQTSKIDGAITLITLAATLFFSPHLDKGIILGVLLSAGFYIYTRTRPKIIRLSSDTKNILHDIKIYGLKPCRHVEIVRFDGSLFFANVAYLENTLEKLVRNSSHDMKAIILCADGINYIDYSGVEILGHMAVKFRELKIRFIITAMKSHILNIIKKSYMYGDIGADNFIQRERMAIAGIYYASHEKSREKNCPLDGYVKAWRHAKKITTD